MNVRKIARRVFKAILEKAGLPDAFSIYSLRHTMATLLLQDGENSKTVQERKGTAPSFRLTIPTLTCSRQCSRGPRAGWKRSCSAGAADSHAACFSERQEDHREKCPQAQRYVPVARRRGEPFTPADFKKVAPITTARRELQRLVQAGKIKAVSEDLYVKPRHHELLLGEMSPTLDKILKALTTKQGHVCQMNGGEAANRLGLSPDVPMKPVYLTNGPSRLVMLGKLELKLHHRPIEELPAAGQMAGDVIQAFHHLGPRRVKSKQVERLNKTLLPETKARLRKLGLRLPAWMREVIEQFD